MGCVSSKLCREELQRDILCDANGECPAASRHVVSLTSSTYGALNKFEGTSSLKQTVNQKKETEQQQEQMKKNDDIEKVPPTPTTAGLNSNVKLTVSPPPRETNICGEEVSEEEETDTEIINTWELMGDLEEQSPNEGKKPNNKSTNRSPFKRLNKLISPKTVNKPPIGKENHRSASVGGNRSSFFTPNLSGTRSTGRLMLKNSSSVESPSSVSNSNRRRSLTPLFDPELVEAYEKELSEEGEHIKKVISQSPSNQKPVTYLESFEEKCPPGGEDAVVFYTTSLRGIRKTFEECNVVRSVLDSYSIRMYERDISMDSGFKEELRKLMGQTKFKVPVVFVKGRVIGGAEEVVKMDEEGKLGKVLSGIERMELGVVCRGCGGLWFVMCLECNGSRKVLDHQDAAAAAANAVYGKNIVRCGECNENGLIRCPVCC